MCIYNSMNWKKKFLRENANNVSVSNGSIQCLEPKHSMRIHSEVS